MKMSLHIENLSYKPPGRCEIDWSNTPLGFLINDIIIKICSDGAEGAIHMMKQISTAFYMGVVEVLTNRVYGLMCPKESEELQMHAVEIAEKLIVTSEDPLHYEGIEEKKIGIRVV